MSCELTVMDGFRLGLGVWLFAFGLLAVSVVVLAIIAAFIAVVRAAGRRQTPEKKQSEEHRGKSFTPPRPWN
mgnify:CR=1 FL=1